VRSDSRDEGHRDLPGDGRGAIEALLTGGRPRSPRNAGVVVDAVSRQPERLEELVQCVFSADEIVRMRASDALEKVCRSHPRLLQRFVPRLLGEMARIEQASVQWHLAQILAEVPLDEEQRAQAITVLEHNLDTSGDWIVTNCNAPGTGHVRQGLPCCPGAEPAVIIAGWLICPARASQAPGHRASLAVAHGPRAPSAERRLFTGSGAWSPVPAPYADLPFMYLFELVADDLWGTVTCSRARSEVARTSLLGSA
jgi:hypothetical protein